MTPKDRELVLKDLCERLPYMVKLHNITTNEDVELYAIDLNSRMASFWKFKGNSLQIGDISSIFRGDGSIRLKPYLRPMSSITDKEKEEIKPFFSELRDEAGRRVLVVRQNEMPLYQDYLNAYFLDYRGLIPKGLALEAPEGMYKVGRE